MPNPNAKTIVATLRALSDFDLDIVRKAVDEEGRRRGRIWAERDRASFGRRSGAG